MDEIFELPVKPNEVRRFCIIVAVHECCHMFGLVENNNVLGGIGRHNPIPNNYIMDDGTTVPYEQYFGRGETQSWRGLNARYLKFVLPKEEEK